MQKERKDEGLEALGRETEYNSAYAPEVLETFENRHQENDYWVRFNCPENSASTRSLRPCWCREESIRSTRPARSSVPVFPPCMTHS